MANATATITVNAFPSGKDNTIRRALFDGIISLSAGGDYVTNGIPLNWNAMVDPSGLSIPQPAGPETNQPADVWLRGEETGYTYVFDDTLNTLRIWNGGTELTNATVPTTDVIHFRAEWPKGTL